jgi:hypothetical protein
MPKNIGWTMAAIALFSVTACSNKADDGQVAADQSAAKPLGSSWTDIDKMPDFFTGNWQSVSSMVDGPTDVGYTDKAKEYIANYKPKADIQLANETCKTTGMPIVMRSSTPVKFMYEPGMIAIYLEHASQTRFIFLNQEPVSTNPTYLGNSTGHFEGDTLVVESVGFVDDIVFQYGARRGAAKVTPGAFPEPGSEGQSFLSNVIFGPHGPNLRMVERMRLSEPDMLEIKTTIYDDTVFTTPYEVETRYWKRQTGKQGKPQEWVCTVAISYFDEKANVHKDLSPEEVLKRLEQQEADASGL